MLLKKKVEKLTKDEIVKESIKLKISNYKPKRVIKSSFDVDNKGVKNVNELITSYDWDDFVK